VSKDAAGLNQNGKREVVLCGSAYAETFFISPGAGTVFFFQFH